MKKAAKKATKRVVPTSYAFAIRVRTIEGIKEVVPGSVVEVEWIDAASELGIVVGKFCGEIEVAFVDRPNADEGTTDSIEASQIARVLGRVDLKSF